MRRFIDSTIYYRKNSTIFYTYVFDEIFDFCVKIRVCDLRLFVFSFRRNFRFEILFIDVRVLRRTKKIENLL